MYADTNTRVDNKQPQEKETLESQRLTNILNAINEVANILKTSSIANANILKTHQNALQSTINQNTNEIKLMVDAIGHDLGTVIKHLSLEVPM